MILAIDVGNTNIVIGGLSGEEIFFTARAPGYCVVSM